VRSGPLGDSSRLGDALAALGCAGERAAALACRGDTLVVLDGWLYNRGELGQSLDAEILLELVVERDRPAGGEFHASNVLLS